MFWVRLLQRCWNSVGLAHLFLVCLFTYLTLQYVSQFSPATFLLFCFMLDFVDSLLMPVLVKRSNNSQIFSFPAAHRSKQAQEAWLLSTLQLTPLSWEYCFGTKKGECVWLVDSSLEIIQFFQDLSLVPQPLWVLSGCQCGGKKWLPARNPLDSCRSKGEAELSVEEVQLLKPAVREVCCYGPWDNIGVKFALALFWGNCGIESELIQTRAKHGWVCVDCFCKPQSCPGECRQEKWHAST